MLSADTSPINNFETNVGHVRAGSGRGPAFPAKRFVNVETLLEWAFRDELPKDRQQGGRFGGSGYSSPLGQLVASGTRVDNWSSEPGYPAALGGPHPDALIVEAAVERLADLADQAIEGELDLVPDAGAIGMLDEHAAVRRALAMLPAIVARTAKLGRRPPWRASPRPEPLLAGNGRPQVVRWGPVTTPIRNSDGSQGPAWTREELVPVTAGGGKDNYPEDSYCPVQYEPSLQSVAEERAEYLVWWGALDHLAGDLAGKLSTWAVLPPSAPQRPWNEDVDLGEPPRVLSDTSARAYRREARETAAAHRMLGQRRQQSMRRGARPGTGPTRMVRAAPAAQRTCVHG